VTEETRQVIINKLPSQVKSDIEKSEAESKNIKEHFDEQKRLEDAEKTLKLFKEKVNKAQVDADEIENQIIQLQDDGEEDQAKLLVKEAKNRKIALLR